MLSGYKAIKQKLVTNKTNYLKCYNLFFNNSGPDFFIDSKVAEYLANSNIENTTSIKPNINS